MSRLTIVDSNNNKAKQRIETVEKTLTVKEYKTFSSTTAKVCSDVTIKLAEMVSENKMKLIAVLAY